MVVDTSMPFVHPDWWSLEGKISNRSTVPFTINPDSRCVGTTAVGEQVRFKLLHHPKRIRKVPPGAVHHFSLRAEGAKSERIVKVECSAFTEGRAITIEDAFTYPIAKSIVHPRYPEHVLASDVNRDVRIEVLVGSDGDVADIRHSGDEDDDPALFESAAKAVLRWTYEPATLNGRPIAESVSETIEFDDDFAVVAVLPQAPSKAIPPLRGLLDPRFPVVIPLPETGGFVAAAVVTLAKSGTRTVLTYVIRYGEGPSADETWVTAILSRRRLYESGNHRCMIVEANRSDLLRFGQMLATELEPKPLDVGFLAVFERFAGRQIVPGLGSQPGGGPEWNPQAIRRIAETMLSPSPDERQGLDPSSSGSTVTSNSPDESAIIRRDSTAFVLEPRVVRKKIPPYPQTERWTGPKEIVPVSAVVDALGHVIEAEAPYRGPDSMRRAAAEAICDWEYQPAVASDGETAEYRTSVVFEFVGTSTGR